VSPVRHPISNRFRSVGPAAAICAASAIAVAGCGSSSTTASTGASGASGATGASGAALSQTEFVSQANAICADVNNQIQALKAPSSDLGSIATFASEGLGIVKPALQKFQGMTPPANLQAKWDAFLSQGQTQISAEEALQSAAQAGNTAQVQAAVAKIKSQHSDAPARALGLTECAKNVQPQG